MADRRPTPLDAAGAWLDVAEGAIDRALEAMDADADELQRAAGRAALERAMRLMTTTRELRVEWAVRARLCGERGLDGGCHARLSAGCAGACEGG